MTAIVNQKINKDKQDLLNKNSKINYFKKYPYWVYIILGLGLAGLIVAIATTVLVSNIYWAYSNYYFHDLEANHQFSTNVGKELGPNDFWKLILINPEIFNFTKYSSTVIINGQEVVINTLDQTQQLNAYFTLFEQWCEKNNTFLFLDEEQFSVFALFFNTFDSVNNSFVFKTQIANQLWNPNGNAYYITTCVFWIASVITLTIILINWWAYIVKQIRANQLPKAERIAAKKAKKQQKLLIKQRKAKIKELKDKNAFKKPLQNNLTKNNSTLNNNLNENKTLTQTKINEPNLMMNNVDNSLITTEKYHNLVKLEYLLVKLLSEIKEE